MIRNPFNRLVARPSKLALVGFFSFFAFFCWFTKAPAQVSITKAAIDTGDFDHWPLVTWGAMPAITNDGKYVSYGVGNPYFSPNKEQWFTLQAIRGDWKKEFRDVSYGSFTDDSRKAIFIKPKDSLCILTLGTSSAEYVPNVRSYSLFRQGKIEWLAYEMSSPEKTLVLRNLRDDKTHSYSDIASYQVTKDGTILVLMIESKKDTIVTHSIQWVAFPTDKPVTIWESSTAEAGNIVLDNAGNQLAFVVTEKRNEGTEYSFWHYKAGMKKAVVLLDNTSRSLEAGLRLHSIEQFSNDGKRLFCVLKKKETNEKPKPDAVKVDVWSYLDVTLQSQQLKELVSPGEFGGIGAPGHGYTVVVNLDINNRRIVRLQNEDEHIMFFGEGKPDDVVIITHRKGNTDEMNWNRESQSTPYLVFTKTGERRKIEGYRDAGIHTPLSPSGKYLIYGDGGWRNFFCYEIASGKTKNITANLPIPLVDENFDDSPGPKPRGITLLAWVDNEEAVLIRDKFDVWQLDIAGKKPPINLTNGYGRRNNITFRLAGGFKYRIDPVAMNEELLLSAFNETNKHNGFFRIVVGKQRDPELLTMGSYMYCMPEYPRGLPDFSPLKARDANIWIIKRESASEAPNWFWTTDFKTYMPISNTYPEKNYKWLTSELVTFKTLDGRTEDGVLYKPENFDQKKKYPVIIHYYEKLAHRLNVYEWPEAMSNNLNIPWFVSRGYVVFTPDIHYTIGEPGPSAYNSIVGAAKHLVQLPWVNPSKIGIQGHSWGGYETNYVVTQTDMFAAAMSSAGVSDFISSYGSLLGSGHSKQFFYELHQSRMGKIPWEIPELYIKNSPIFFAHKVTTPLLMMNNKKDGAVEFDQGVEYFTALRRLGKRAWMLQYDDGAHSLHKEKDQLQHTIRVTQFFDHYLKDAPAPKWMTRGIPAKMKGIDDGLELDHEIKTPGRGLLIEETKTQKAGG